MVKYVKTEQGYVDASIFAPAQFKPEGKSYLTFSSPNNFTLEVNNRTKNWDGILEYFAYDKTWTVWDGTTILSGHNNDDEYVLYLRGTGNTKITGIGTNKNWIITGTDIKCIGNIENLLDYATVEAGNHPTMTTSCYSYMFKNCTALTQAPDLPATTLANNCYESMFYGCTALTQAPALLATTLADYCYQLMFYGCTSLTKAPDLLATTLANSCYQLMFEGCTALTQAPDLPATTLVHWCYRNMFYGCTALTQAPALPATTLADYCYSSMFSGCSSLTQAPELPATSLANNCYESMFSGCTALKLSSTKTVEYAQEYRIPTTGTGTTATDALTNMFVSTGGTFTGTPAINTTYYLSTDNMIVRDTEVATLNGYVGSMIDNSVSNPLNITGATVGQIAKITAVDESGKPTSWEAVDDRLPKVSVSDAGNVLGVEQIGEHEYGYALTHMPTLSDFIPLGITNASPGQFAKVSFVDDFGNPTAWEAADIYDKPTSGIPKSDLADDVQTSLNKADTAISLGLTAATPGQIIKVKTVQDGKPTKWEAVNPDYTLTVTVNTQDGVTVTGQTVTVRAGDADGPVYGTAEYNGQPVSFRVADGFAYYAEVTDNLAAHFKPTSVKGVINGANAAVTLLYNDFSTIQTASDIQAALDADMDLTGLVGQQITCQRGNDTLPWDVVDYDSTAKVVTLCTHDVLPDNMQFEPPQALMYCEDGLTAGSYTFKQSNAQYYFTLTQAIPAGGQLRATTREFQTYGSTTATAQIEYGTVSTDVIDGATNLGQTGTGNLNHHDRVNFASGNSGESGILQWLNSDSPANTPMPRLTKFSRPYVPTKAGFKADLDAEFLACIQDTTWACSANNEYECPVSLGGIAQKGKPYTVTAKFALASEIEVFGEYGGVQDGGTVWDLYVGAEATDRIKYYNNSAQSWWLRSPNWYGAYFVRVVNTSGVGIHNVARNSVGVAVACKIAKSN